MPEQIEERGFRHGGNLVWGLGLITAGCLFLFDRLGMIDALEFWTLFPALIALDGLIDIVASRNAEKVIKGCFNLVLAFWLYASVEHLWGLNFRNSWPILPIAIGAQTLLSGLLASRK